MFTLACFSFCILNSVRLAVIDYFKTFKSDDDGGKTLIYSSPCHFKHS